MTIITKADGTKVNQSIISQGKGKKPIVIERIISSPNSSDKIGINLSKNNAISKIKESTKNGFQAIKNFLTNETARKQAIEEAKKNPMQKIQEQLNKQIQLKKLEQTIQEEQKKKEENKKKSIREAFKNIPILKIMAKTTDTKKKIEDKTTNYIKQEKANYKNTQNIIKERDKLNEQSSNIAKDEFYKQIKDTDRFTYNKIIGETYTSKGVDNYKVSQDNKKIEQWNNKLTRMYNDTNSKIEKLNKINEKLGMSASEEQYNQILKTQYLPLKSQIDWDTSTLETEYNKAKKDMAFMTPLRLNKDSQKQREYEGNLKNYENKISTEAKRLGMSDYEYKKTIESLKQSQNYIKSHEKTKMINPSYWLNKANIYDTNWRLSNTGNKIVNATPPLAYLNPTYDAYKLYPNKVTENIYKYTSEYPYKYVTEHAPSLALTYGEGKLFGTGLQAIGQGTTYLSKYGPNAYKAGKYGAIAAETAFGGYVLGKTGYNIYLTPKEERGREIVNTIIDFTTFGIGAKKGFKRYEERTPIEAKSNYKKEIEITNPDESLRNVETIKEISKRTLEPKKETFIFTQKDSLTGRKWKGKLNIDEKGNVEITQKSGEITEKIRINKNGKGHSKRTIKGKVVEEKKIEIPKEKTKIINLQNDEIKRLSIIKESKENWINKKLLRDRDIEILSKEKKQKSTGRLYNPKPEITRTTRGYTTTGKDSPVFLEERADYGTQEFETTKRTKRRNPTQIGYKGMKISTDTTERTPIKVGEDERPSFLRYDVNKLTNDQELSRYKLKSKRKIGTIRKKEIIFPREDRWFSKLGMQNENLGKRGELRLYEPERKLDYKNDLFKDYDTTRISKLEPRDYVKLSEDIRTRPEIFKISGKDQIIVPIYKTNNKISNELIQTPYTEQVPLISNKLSLSQVQQQVNQLNNYQKQELINKQLQQQMINDQIIGPQIPPTIPILPIFGLPTGGSLGKDSYNNLEENLAWIDRYNTPYFKSFGKKRKNNFNNINNKFMLRTFY